MSLSRAKSSILQGKNLSELEHLGNSTQFGNLGNNDPSEEYSLFEKSHLATSEFRKLEMEVRMGASQQGERLENFDNFEKFKGEENLKSYRSHQLPVRGARNTDDADIDCISTTVRKFFS